MLLHDPAQISAGANPAQMGSSAQIGTGFASSMMWARNAHLSRGTGLLPRSCITIC